MKACRQELTLSPAFVRSNPTYLLRLAGRVVGFYSLERLGAQDVELAHLFVEPERIGQGLGRALMDHAKECARRLGYRTMTIQSDPNAKRFYRMSGGRVVGRRPSASIPGRDLPLLRLDLDDART